AHDGLQEEYFPPPQTDVPFAGDAISFRQDYWQYFVGARGSFDAGKPAGLIPVKLLYETRLSFVSGYNKDHHLLRGQRYSFDETYGFGFYFALGFETRLTKNFTLDTGVDYQMFRTYGTHRLDDQTLGIDKTWSNGVKVWSDQIGVKLNFKYRF
ncbi:MAG TPA: hypothetical protein PLU24_03790, partial [Candidatus Omnitrophota bacterium]|nr:hypothetical protein [Candidatus Omnitrophota bacterium]